MTINLYQMTPRISYPGILDFLGCTFSCISHSHIYICFRCPFSAPLIHKCRYPFIIQLSDTPSDRLLSRLNTAHHSGCTAIQYIPSFLSDVAYKPFVFFRCFIQHIGIAHIQCIFRLFSEITHHLFYILTFICLHCRFSQSPFSQISKTRI